MEIYQTSGFKFDKLRPIFQKYESWLNLEKDNMQQFKKKEL